MGLLPHERSECGFGHAVAEILAERFPVHAAKQLATALSRAGAPPLLGDDRLGRDALARPLTLLP